MKEHSNTSPGKRGDRDQASGKSGGCCGGHGGGQGGGDGGGAHGGEHGGGSKSGGTGGCCGGCGGDSEAAPSGKPNRAPPGGAVARSGFAWRLCLALAIGAAGLLILFGDLVWRRDPVTYVGVGLLLAAGGSFVFLRRQARQRAFTER